MKKCPHCLKEIKEEAKFCGYCGKEIAIDSASSSPQTPESTTERPKAPESPTERPKNNKAIWWILGIIAILAFPTLRTIAITLAIVYLLIRVISKGLENKQKILDSIRPVLGLVILIGFLWFIFHSYHPNTAQTQQGSQGNLGNTDYYSREIASNHPQSNYSTAESATEAFNKGDEYLKQGNYDQAISDYTKAIEINPTDGAYNNRGNAYLNKGNLAQAISDYNQAIGINPNDAIAYYNRGNVYFKQGNYDQAISDYTQAIGINPNYADAYKERGVAYFSKTEYDKTILDLNRAIEINPNDFTAYSGRFYVYLTEENYTQAISDFNKVIELNPGDTKNYLIMGNAFNQAAYGLYKKGKNLEEGIKLIDKALEKSPNNGIYLSTKAELLYKLGRYDEAYEYIKKGIKLEPNQTEIQNDFKMIEEALYESKKR